MNSKKQKQRVTLGLALGGGSARGLAHIGVLQVLEENNISIDFLAGTSMGSLIGAFYANGISIKMIERLAKRLDKKLWVDLTVPRMGILAGDRILKIISFLLRERNFSDLKIPFAVSATDLYTGESITLNKGSVGEAVRASISIPGIFAPVVWKDHLLVDGGVLNRVPVNIVGEMGADVVVAVDTGIYLGMKKANNIIDVITQSIDIMAHEIQKHTITNADILIKPDLREIGASQFHRVEEAVAIGAETTCRVIPAIKNLLEGNN